RAPVAGEILRQPDLARTLGELADGGVDAYYRGTIGRRVADAIGDLGGKLSADDLADHRTEVTDPIAIPYRNYSILATGLPSHGVILLEALNIWQHANRSDPDVCSADAIHRQVEATKIAIIDRLGHTSDPALRQSPMRALLSEEHAARRAAEIDLGNAATEIATVPLQEGDTTYISVVDGDGMMVSLITSLSSAFGSGVVAGDTGIFMNNRAGRGFTLEDGYPNIYAPGKKTMHTLHSYLVAAADGTPLLIGGTPGGDGQPQWNLQTIAGLIDAGLDVQAATELPRWMSWPATDPISLPNPYELRIEDRAGDDVITELERRGHAVRRLGAWEAGGAVQVIARDPETGALTAGSDPRVEGLAVGL
ncbi:MAG: gamma-glutamyltransferase, partial [Chloroflexia bacterium]|nr:gamma-glutamyltransferase [Chloroflexia bacterium]